MTIYRNADPPPWQPIAVWMRHLRKQDTHGTFPAFMRSEGSLFMDMEMKEPGCVAKWDSVEEWVVDLTKRMYAADAEEWAREEMCDSCAGRTANGEACVVSACACECHDFAAGLIE